MRLIYVINARLPTEKAHGYQICKMCEALAGKGAEVKLLHPYRHNPGFEGRTVFDYYGVRPIFEVRMLSNLDVVLFSRWVSARWFTPIFFVHALVWGWFAVREAQKKDADLYYTRDGAVAYWLVWLGLPTLYEAHVVPQRAQRWLLRSMARRRTLRLVVVLTSFIKRELVKIGIPESKIVVLPDAVDLSWFKELPDKEACCRRLSLPLDRPIIGYIGRFRTLEMEKGIPELVEAMTWVPSLNGGEPLLLCVGGPMDVVPTYLGHARRLGVSEHRIRFVDRVPNIEVPYWIRACDVVTIPWPWTEFSAYFTSPMKLFEYMAAGVAMVASDLPSIREVLRHGENAWLVEPGNPKALAEGICAVLSDPDLAQRLGKNARRDVEAYTWEKRAQAILKAVGP